MKQVRIEKRLPFGFVGDWGRLYKRYTVTADTQLNQNETITYEKNYYRDIGQDVQFKQSEDSTSEIGQPMSGLVAETEYRVAETTDAYYDDAKRAYTCVARAGDIVVVFGRKWLVTTVRTVVRHNPARQEFYYLDLMGIL